MSREHESVVVLLRKLLSWRSRIDSEPSAVQYEITEVVDSGPRCSSCNDTGRVDSHQRPGEGTVPCRRCPPQPQAASSTQAGEPFAYVEKYRLGGETHMTLVWDDGERDDREYLPLYLPSHDTDDGFIRDAEGRAIGTDEPATRVPAARSTTPDRAASSTQADDLERAVVAFADLQYQCGKVYALVGCGKAEDSAFTDAAVRCDRAQAELVATIRRLASSTTPGSTGAEPDGYTSYGEFRWACDCNERMRAEWTPLYTAPPAARAPGVDDAMVERAYKASRTGWHQNEMTQMRAALEAALAQPAQQGERGESNA